MRLVVVVHGGRLRTGVCDPTKNLPARAVARIGFDKLCIEVCSRPKRAALVRQHQVRSKVTMAPVLTPGGGGLVLAGRL